MSGDISQQRESVWPHGLVVVLALITFPLIWVGGLVTTYKAGMAVPDWPGTYGYNLFLYPWQTWLAGPWDLFIEHGHRLLGAAAGVVSIALVAVVVATDRRRWLMWASVGALFLVIVQGVLGGARVLLDERLVAMIHGCVGPLFFAYLAALVVLTSRQAQPNASAEIVGLEEFARAASVNVALAYLQLVLGAVLRHVPLAASPGVFRAALLLHLLFAVALAAHVLMVAIRSRVIPRGARGLKRLAWVALVLVFVQLGLGLATYVAKYAFPAWLGDFAFSANFVIQEKGLTQSLITTAHVANGSLILFVSVLLAARVFVVVRLSRLNPHEGARTSAKYSVLRSCFKTVRREGDRHILLRVQSKMSQSPTVMKQLLSTQYQLLSTIPPTKNLPRPLLNRF